MNQPEWCQDVLAACEVMPDRKDRRASLESVPDWVERIDKELERRNFPISLEDDEEASPRKAGQLIGQTYAYYGWILDCLRRENSALSDRLRRSATDSFD